MDKRIVGKWRTTDNDPDDDGEWNCEFIRRADGTTTTMYSMKKMKNHYFRMVSVQFETECIMEWI